MKVFITKYALTNGVTEVEAERNGAIMVSWFAGYDLQFSHKPDWHETLHEAFTRAEVMRVAKIASLRKSIAKLEKLKFEVVG